MKLVRLSYILILSSCIEIVLTLNTTSEQNGNDENISVPAWTYKCVQDKGCQRQTQKNNSTTQSVGIFTSIDVCRLTCGRFGSIWPRPSAVALGMQLLRIHPLYVRFDLMDTPPSTRSMMTEMAQLFTNNINALCINEVTIMSETKVTIYINIKSDDTSLTWDTDESYNLDLQSRNGHVSVNIVAETIFGARHGLETLSQLIAPTIPLSDKNRSKCGLLIVNGAKIKDRPVYSHRGLMLDTARNFMSVDAIKRTMEGMASAKMNVFHWHASDSHSFPLESIQVPLLSKYGAYSSGEMYRVEDINEIMHFARVRGIRVLMEFDAPAHAGNGWQWGPEYGLGDLAVCVNQSPWQDLCIQPPCGQLNPVNPNLYKILKDLYTDYSNMLPDGEFFHMGGDEVFVDCWNSSKEIREYLDQKGFGLSKDSYIRLWAEFQAKVLKLWTEVSKEEAPVILWSSELTQKQNIEKFLNRDRYVIQVWEVESSNLMNDLLKLGYRVIASPKDRWYLDHGFWGNTRFSNWLRMYEYNLPDSNLVLGGEVAMWSEYVDSSTLDGRVWPRALGPAERLWSNPAPTSKAAKAIPRVSAHIERLRSRGIHTDVFAPLWCNYNDMLCLNTRL